jgi:hypothetical protein
MMLGLRQLVSADLLESGRQIPADQIMPVPDVVTQLVALRSRAAAGILWLRGNAVCHYPRRRVCAAMGCTVPIRRSAEVCDPA